MKTMFRRLALMLAIFSLCFTDGLFRSEKVQAASMHFRCVPNEPPEYNWKKEVIPPPVTQLFIDTDAKTLRYENTWGVQQYKDGVTHDTDDPHVGLVDRVEFYGYYVHGYQQQIVAPGYSTMRNYGDRTGVLFNLQQLGLLRAIPRMGGIQEIYTHYCTPTPPSK